MSARPTDWFGLLTAQSGSFPGSRDPLVDPVLERLVSYSYFKTTKLIVMHKLCRQLGYVHVSKQFRNEALRSRCPPVGALRGSSFVWMLV